MDLLTLRVDERLGSIGRERWDRLVPPGARPFLSWDYLELLESSGSASPETGWSGAHVSVWRGETLVAACPAYVKPHSYGEFFYNDFRWSDFCARMGVSYYPRLFVGPPFSPASAPRLLVAPEENASALRRLLARGLVSLAERLSLSSVHLPFVSSEELEDLREEGFHPGAGMQFHWRNEGFGSFEDYLARFNAKRRRQVKDERSRLQKEGIELRVLSGPELDEPLMRFVSRCYERTVDSHFSGMTHLKEDFFVQSARRLPREVEVVLAERAGRPIASAFNLRGDKRLYGRVWGALEEHHSLHFNVCYYRGIEHCIASGLEAFEPGAGGEHKVARGFAPTLVQSAHYFLEPGLHALFGRFLAREHQAFETRIRELREAGIAFNAGASARFG